MAQLEGLIRKMNGSVGDFTFKQVKGQTIVSEKVTHIANPRTEAQMSLPALPSSELRIMSVSLRGNRWVQGFDALLL